MEFITGQQASVEQRARIARALKMSEIGILNSRVTAEQGNLQLALDQAQKAVDTKYAPIKELLQIRQSQIEALTPLFNAAEKREAEALKRRNELADRAVDFQREDEKQNLNTSLEYAGVASEYGQKDLAGQFAALDPASKTFRKDLSNLISQVKDPRLALDLALKQAQLDNVKADTKALLQKLKEQGEPEDTQGQVDSLNLKIDLIDSILSNDALSTSVGPNILSRAASESFVQGLGPVAGTGFVNRFTGETQGFIAGVEQLVSKEFIDNLINAKGQGATFGALSDSEKTALTAAATKIGTWRIQRNNKVVGYDVDEQRFKDELNIIRTSAEKVKQRLGGNTLQDNEKSLLNSVFQSGSFDPSLAF